jgi:hypothetical protein
MIVGLAPGYLVPFMKYIKISTSFKDNIPRYTKHSVSR